MLKIGLTGGIGSGKTTVAKIFETLKIPVYYADTEAKKILNDNISVKKQIIKTFGNIYSENIIDKKKLAYIVFNNTKKLAELNSIVHPAVNIHFKKWCKEKENYNYTIKEAAILFESGAYKKMDKIINVYAPVDIRIKRVCLRDNVKKEDVLNRINNQFDDKKRIELSDFIVHNYNEHMIIHQVLSIHKTNMQNN
ncbi:MAG: dephospho-CoA kinase [Bacteroidota bacterium]|nr:dephospho-CoA kinase [Bacteroidota bacterium]